MYKSVFTSQIKLIYVSLFQITRAEYQFPSGMIHTADLVCKVLMPKRFYGR